jgi:capping protein beta
MSDEQLNSALNLMRRMPPSSVENSLAGLIELVPSLTDDLLNHVDQPLKIAKDGDSGKAYILCDYNRDADSYRSPWSNKYYPQMDDGFMPSKTLRDLEVSANHVFDHYRKLFFEGGVSSVYMFDTDEKEDSFGSCWLIHKDVDSAGNFKKGWWDSIHVFETTPLGGDQFQYKLTATVMVSMVVEDDKVGKVDLSGSMTQQEVKKLKIDKHTGHIAHMGKMLEDMELRIRNSIEGVYIQKTRFVINGMRAASGAKEKAWGAIAESMQSAQIGKGLGPGKGIGGSALRR